MRAVSKRSSCTSAPTYPLSPINAAVVISQFHVLHIIEVKYAGLGQVIGMYQPTQSANCVKFVPKVIFMLRGTEAEVGSLHELPCPSHPATPASCHSAHCYRLGIHKEEVFPTVHFHGNPLSYVFT